MAKTLQFRRGTTSQLSTVTGAVGELFVDTTKDVVVVMDGATPGGFPLQNELVSGTNIKTVNGTSLLGSGDITIAGGSGIALTDLSATVTSGGSEPSASLTYSNTTGQFTLSPVDLSNKQNTLVSGTNIKTINGNSLLGSGDITIAGGSGDADFSAVAEDILPLFTEIFDLGSTTRRWDNAYLTRTLDIGGAEFIGSEDGVVIPNAALIDQLLISNNMITPDDSTAREYLGAKGIVIVNGNMDVQGDWLGAPVVQTFEEIIASIAGELDPAFDIGTGFNGTVFSIALQADGKILVGGTFTAYDGVSQSRIARLNPDGSRDTSFNIGTGFNNGVLSIAIQSDGKIVVGGWFNGYNGTSIGFGIARLNSDGTLDTSFNTGSGFNSDVNSIAIQEDGKILVGGWFNAYNGNSQNYIIRLNSDGSRDTSFNIGFGFTNGVSSIDIQEDGKILVGGFFNAYNGTSTGYGITRLNADGTRDTSFNNNGSGFNGGAYSIALQEDGKISVGGFFSSYNGTGIGFGIARLNSDGSLDTSFNTGSGFDGGAYSIALQEDGKISVGGFFSSYNGTGIGYGFARLNSDGSRDLSFNIGSGFNSGVQSIALQADGKILVGGFFSSYNGVTQNRIVSLLAENVVGQPASFPPVNGEEGFIRYNKDIAAFQVHNGTEWDVIGSSYTLPTASDSVLGGIKIGSGLSIDGNGVVSAIGGGSSYDQDLNTTDDVVFNSVLVGNLNCQFDTTVVSTGLINVTDSSAAGAFWNIVGGAPVGFLAVGTLYMSLEDQNKLLSLTPGTVVQYTNLQHPFGTFSGSFTVAQPSVPGDTDRINIYINVGGFLPEIGSAINSNFFAVNINFTWTGDITTGTIVNALSVSIDTVAINGTLTVNGQPLSETDLSEVTEDILPLFSEVYDIGSANKRWYDLYLTNNLDIGGAALTGADGVLSTAADVVVGSLLSDQLLLSDNMITPDDSTAREYLGAKGIVIVNGNMSVQGDWLGAPVVETIPESIISSIGELDSIFADNIGSGFNQYVTSVVKQPDGKILVGGRFVNFKGVPLASPQLVRFNTDGTLDTSFDAQIQIDDSDGVRSVVLQPDGKILVGMSGNLNQRLVRLNADGSADNSFYNVGFNGGVEAIALQSDGKILVGGSFNYLFYVGRTQNRIARLNHDGTLDVVFSNQVGFDGLVSNLVIQADGKILVAGSFNEYIGIDGSGTISVFVTQRSLARLNIDGTLDSSFNNNVNTGGAYLPFSPNIDDLAVQADGKIIVVGAWATGSTRAIVRFNPDGVADTSFNYGDIASVLNAGIQSVAIQEDGKIFVGGTADSSGNAGVDVPTAFVIRLNSDGTIDNDFNRGTGATDPSVNPALIELVIEPDGNILVGGQFGAFNGVTAGKLTRILGNTISIPASSPSTTGEEGLIRYNKDITAFEGHNGTSWQLLERVTTPPTELESTGTVDVDFSGASLRTQGALTGNITYTGSSYAPGSSVTIRVTNGSTQRNVTFPTGWLFVGEKPTNIAANKTAILTVTSFGTTEADCVAAWAVQA